MFDYRKAKFPGQGPLVSLCEPLHLRMNIVGEANHVSGLVLVNFFRPTHVDQYRILENSGQEGLTLDIHLDKIPLLDEWSSNAAAANQRRWKGAGKMTTERMAEILGYLSERVYDEDGTTLPEIQRILDELSDSQFRKKKDSPSGLVRYVLGRLKEEWPQEYAEVANR
jgi:hypothetical protein